MDIKEFTREEFDKFIAKNNYESFSEKQVSRFASDLIEKSKKGEIDEFETNCGAVEYSLLQKAIVVENDLTKSLVYYRENQREPIEIPDGIFKSTSNEALFKYRETPLNILKGIAGICCADKDAIEKAKALPIGTEKTYGGKVYVKTERGWRPKAKGTRGAAKQEAEKGSTNEAASKTTSNTPKEEKKVPSSTKTERKTSRGGSAASSISEYNGKIGGPADTSKLKKLSESYAKSGDVEKDYVFSNALSLVQRCNDEELDDLIARNKKAQQEGHKLANYDLNDAIMEYNKMKSDLDKASTPEEKSELQKVLDRSEKFLGKVKAEIPEIYAEELKQAKKNEAKVAKKEAKIKAETEADK